MIEATIDGVPWSSLGIGIIRRDIPPLPETRDYSVQIAGRDGELDLGTEYGARVVQHECILMADDPRLDYQARVREIARLFDARKGERIVIYDDLPGKRYRMRYAGSLPIEKIIFDGNFTLPMKMFDPYPEAANEAITEVNFTASPYNLPIQSDGDLSASPIFVVTNTGGTTLNGFKLRIEYEID